MTKEDLQKIATTRNHTVISFDNYENVHSVFGVRCNTCTHTWETTVHSYKNAKKTGCPDCKKKITSETHKEKVTSDETKRKIGEKASQRPGSLTGKKGELHPRYKGRRARDFKNPSNADYEWKTAVRKRCNFTCVITQVKYSTGSDQRYVCHHLNSFDVHPDLRYVPENGVFLKREIHGEFHKSYGFGNNSESQFAEFCLKFYGIQWFDRKKELNLS